jgi:hypothetical protein
MTLAAILLAALLTAPGLAEPGVLREADPSVRELVFAARFASSESTQAVTTPATTQDQGTTTPTQNPANSAKPTPSASNSSQTSSSQTSSSQTSTSQTPAARAKRLRRKKKPAAVNCDASVGQTTPGQTTAPSGSTPASPETVDAKTSAPQANSASGGSSPSATGAPDNCPPTKKIVPQGGSSEPTIQLVGGKGGQQSSADKDTANQLLGSTEENLKKIAGQQLTSSQQDMVDQVRQFVTQSKTAEAAGDVERARALALKAQLLSQELVKPQQ